MVLECVNWVPFALLQLLSLLRGTVVSILWNRFCTVNPTRRDFGWACYFGSLFLRPGGVLACPIAVRRRVTYTRMVRLLYPGKGDRPEKGDIAMGGIL
jgi:hypothetical protein